MEKLPQRKHPAHFPPRESHNRATIVFLTVCTQGRRPLLANHVVHQHLRVIWKNASRWLVGRYLLMPDHLHLFCSRGIESAPALMQWVAFWKSRAATGWPPPRVGHVWQRDGWDTQLRSGQSYTETWEYVRQNPVRAGLVSTPEHWPYQGELNTLWWHD
jgi:REP element-mobilizing transposase RayT